MRNRKTIRLNFKQSISKSAYISYFSGNIRLCASGLTKQFGRFPETFQLIVSNKKLTDSNKIFFAFKAVDSRIERFCWGTTANRVSRAIYRGDSVIKDMFNLTEKPTTWYVKIKQ